LVDLAARDPHDAIGPTMAMTAALGRDRRHGDAVRAYVGERIGLASR
jgi:hypothetical protein